MTARAPRGPAELHGAPLSDREKLLFEAGIKLGGLFHQYLGTPVSPKTAAPLARTIERAIALQPYVRAVRVRVDPSRGAPLGRGAFRYRYLTAEMLAATVTLAHRGTEVTASLGPRPDLRYPLMRVVAVRSPATRRSASRSERRRGRWARRSATSAG